MKTHVSHAPARSVRVKAEIARTSTLTKLLVKTYTKSDSGRNCGFLIEMVD